MAVSEPKRVQRKRTKGWRMPEAAEGSVASSYIRGLLGRQIKETRTAQ